MTGDEERIALSKDGRHRLYCGGFLDIARNQLSDAIDFFH